MAGIAGNNNSATVENCLNRGDVSGSKCVAGIAGSNGTVTNCANTAVIKAQNGYCGGICGHTGIITGCYNLADIFGYGDDGTGFTSVGGIQRS